MTTSTSDDFWKQRIRSSGGTSTVRATTPTCDDLLIMNDDWEATCSIYADLKTDSKLDISGKGVIRSIDIPLSSTLRKVTFGRAMSPNFETVRVWTLPPSQYPVLRLSFLYYYYYYSEGAISCSSPESLPDSISSIELLTEYPHTWPDQPDGTSWLHWLHQQAAACLVRSHGMSYAVCEWIEHHALDYFVCFENFYKDSDKNSSNNSCIDVESDDGYRFLVFPDKGPTFYDVESLAITKLTTAIIKNYKTYKWRASDFRIVKHLPNNGRTQLTDVHHEFFLFSGPEQNGKQLLTVIAQEGRIHPLVLEKDSWCPHTCDICLETRLKKDMETIACGHAFCEPCLVQYFEHKVEDIQERRHRDNPFRCPLPSCRRVLPIVGCVKQYLTNDKMDQVRAWYKDLTHPPSYALPDCISKSCTSNNNRVNTMRKVAVDSFFVQCDVCRRRWCEWCLQKLEPDEDEEQHVAVKDNRCNAAQCVQFCQRYLAASPQARAACEAKWPWIAVYARSRIDLDQAAAWLLNDKQGQICPVCKNGVERSEGCFHIHCTCGAHFCYECGEEIFYPFYGTHHCWEQR